MSFYKKRIYASFLLILSVLLFIIAGYFFVNKKSIQQDHIKEAVTLLHEVEHHSFLISDHIRELSLLSEISPDKDHQQFNQLKMDGNSMKSSFNNFHDVVKNESLLLNVDGSEFQKAFQNINLHFNAYINQVESAAAISSDEMLIRQDYNIQTGSTELNLRKDFAILSNFLLQEYDRVELLKNNLKTVILGTLLMSLIIALLLVTPSVRLNIIANKKLEDALSEAINSGDILRCIIDTSPDLIFIMDAQHKYKLVNKTFAESMNLSPQQCIGKDDIELEIFKNEGERKNAIEIKKRKENNAIFKTGEIIKIPEEILTINEEQKIYSTVKMPLKDSKGNIWGLLGRSQDITARKIAEKVMYNSEQKYRHLFIDNPLPMWVLDMGTLHFLEVNNEATNLYGYSEREFLSLSIFDILPGEEKERVVQIVKHIASGHNSFKKRKTCTHIKKNGENIFVDVDADIIEFNGKQAFLFSVKDVTAAIKLQKQIVIEKVNHQKEISKTIIATQEKERAEIAKELHDNVNQILTSAKLHIECLTSESVDIHRKSSIELIKTGIKEIRKLSNSIISPSLNQFGLVHSINELLNNILLTSFARIEFNHQSFMEDSIEPDLELTIYRIVQEQTTNILKYAEATIIQVELKQFENYLQLNITDNGKGFDTNTSNKGVGFTNMMNRAQMHNGDFRLSSSPGNGCSLSIDFKLNLILKSIPLLHSA